MNQRPPERRQLTVMFCDLVGSTELAEAMDPEDYASFILDYRSACSTPVAKFGGTVAHYLGDGVLVYFGYPDASESAAYSAVRAALDIVASLTGLEARSSDTGPTNLAVRIGIHTGIVVVGDVVEGEPLEPMAIFGSVPNIAARLQAEAAPNAIVLSADTFRLLRGQIQCRHLGPRKLRGVSTQLDLYEAVAAMSNAAAGPTSKQSSRLIGRENQRTLLSATWERALGGAGRALLLYGEPGIGKSCLVQDFVERLTAQQQRWLIARGSAHARLSEFFPLAEMFRRELSGADAHGEVKISFERLSEMFGERMAPIDDALAFTSLLSLDPPPAMRNALDERQLNSLTTSAVIRWLEHEAGREPLALIVEDLHWADASTLELLSRLLVATEKLPLLVLLTARDVQAELPAYLERHHLQPLASDEADALLTLQPNAANLSRQTRNAILRRANGNPLFIEELVRALGQDADMSAQGADRLSDISIPPTLRDTLMARLDRLGSHKLVAQVASVLGYRFPLRLIEAMWRGGERDLCAGLQELTRADLLITAPESKEPTYEFKHALIQETAYSSLLKRDRRRHHAQAADAMREHYPHDIAARPEQIAWHLSASDQPSSAFEAWLEAARASSRRSANAEALFHLQRAEAEIDKLSAQSAHERAAYRLELRLASAPVLIARLGWATLEVEEAYRDALDACDETEASEAVRFEALRGLANVYLLRGNINKVNEIIPRICKISQKSSSMNLTIGSHGIPGLCRFLEANFAKAEYHLDAVLRLYDPTRYGRTADQYGVNPIATATVWRAWTAWFKGHYDLVGPLLDDAGRLAEGHLFSSAYVSCFAACVAQFDGNPDEALHHASVARKLADKHEFNYWQAWADVVKGWALVRQGNRDEGLIVLTAGIDAYAVLGAAQMRGLWLCLLADAQLRAGRHLQAAATAQSAVDDATHTGICFYLPEAYRLLGEAQLALAPQCHAGVIALLRAIQVARRQSSPVLLVKAAQAVLWQVERNCVRQVVETYACRTTRELLERPSMSPVVSRALATAELARQR